MTWRFEFDAPLGSRILNSGWGGITCFHKDEALWWNYDLKKWTSRAEGGVSSHNFGPKSFKAFKRYLRNHPELKSQEVVFVSRYWGHDIRAVWSESD